MIPVENKQRAYKPTVLNVFAVMLLLFCIGTTIVNYKEMSANEGWGLVGMVGLSGMGLVAFLIDFIIQKAFRNRTAVIIAGIIIATVTVFLFLI